MTSKKLQENLEKKFPFTFTKEQKEIVGSIADFTTSISTRSIFLLKGYAGTGKTTLISALVKSLPSVAKRSVLLAPTGRAAKVLSKYSNKQASTIHRKIYWIRSRKNGNTYIKIKDNTHTNTIFIVDEASMIPEASDSSFGNRSLLDDLIQFVYDGIGCKLILIGDTAQLPPVHLDISPALDEGFLETTYLKDVISVTMKEVVRQSKESTVLSNATDLRNRISVDDFSYPKFDVSSDVVRLESGEELQEQLETAYSVSGVTNTIVLCRSNKRANIYNEQIRARIRFQENEISVGDMLMVVRNNYFWLGEDSKAGFIANGDIVEVVRFKETIDRYGFSFANLTVQLVDYPDEKDLDVIVMLDTLSSETPSLTYDEYKKLYNEVSLDYKGDRELNKKIKENPFFNALQIKFSYAITCHKSQGGQWDNVFVDLGYFKEEMLNKSYLRWLYTATTRASQKLFLINFKEDFFTKHLHP
ncbi:MAG: ATP-dependent endonuclease [Crocinitomicaceae bacterium]|nr:ATP-dependent endonuclease [Crocinitomicaceae bacterium]